MDIEHTKKQLKDLSELLRKSKKILDEIGMVSLKTSDGILISIDPDVDY